MKLRLFEQKRVRVKRILAMAVFTVLSAITSVSCSRDKNVLVTEIGVSSPSRRASKTSQAGEFYIQGQNQHVKGNSQAAIASYDKAIRLNPEYAAAYKSRGLAYFDLGDKQKAIADYNEAIRLSPNDAEAYNSRGNGRAALGDNKGAIADYSQAIRLNPRYAIAYNNRGNARAAQGDQKGAIADYNQAIRLNSNFGPAYNNRGNARAAQGDKQGAMEDLQQAASIFQSQGNNDLYQEVMNNIKELKQ
jgi:tetratricopeptide (TPR) repeat protein